MNKLDTLKKLQSDIIVSTNLLESITKNFIIDTSDRTKLNKYIALGQLFEDMLDNTIKSKEAQSNLTEVDKQKIQKLEDFCRIAQEIADAYK